MPSGSSALNRTAVSLPIQDIILIRDTIGPKGHPVETFALTATVKRFAYINALLPLRRRCLCAQVRMGCEMQENRKFLVRVHYIKS